MEQTNTQFDLIITAEENFLSVTARGKYSLLKANNLFKTAIDECIKHNKNKIFIDVTDIDGSIPFIERLEFSEFLANYRINNALGKVNSIAVLGHEPVVHKERFGETVAVNRGVNVRVFTDSTQASIWLYKN